MNRTAPFVQSLVKNWNSSKKHFVYLKDVHMFIPDYPFRIDLSIVKSSRVNLKSFLLQLIHLKILVLLNKLKITK